MLLLYLSLECSSHQSAQEKTTEENENQEGWRSGKASPSPLIHEGENIAEALSLGEQIQPQLALLDVVLEDEDRIQCAQRLRNVSPQTRMVLVSAYPDREFRRQALSASAVAFLDKKDLDTASVRQVIEDALR